MEVYRQVGFVFEPTNEELVGYFLMTRLNGQQLPSCYPQFFDFNVYCDHPSNVFSLINNVRGVHDEDEDDDGYYFFTQLTRNHPKSKRFNRVVKDHGTWLAKSKIIEVYDSVGNHIGFEKYYKFVPIDEKKKDPLNEDEWQMYEYTLNDVNCQDFVLCHITRKLSPTNKQLRLLAKRSRLISPIIVSEQQNNSEENLSKTSCVEDPMNLDPIDLTFESFLTECGGVNNNNNNDNNNNNNNNNNLLIEGQIDIDHYLEQVAMQEGDQGSIYEQSVSNNGNGVQGGFQADFGGLYNECTNNNVGQLIPRDDYGHVHVHGGVQGGNILGNNFDAIQKDDESVQPSKQLENQARVNEPALVGHRGRIQPRAKKFRKP